MDNEQADFERRSGDGKGSTPNPDPTTLTTEMTMREIASLRTLIDQRINATEQLFEQKIISGIQGGLALKELTASQIADMREVLNERYQTQTKALDAAFVAQQAAVATSFDASEKAMAAALLAAKEAVEKANVAAEKRFDALNELVSQANSSANLLLPRAEAEARISALDARLTDIKGIVDRGFTGMDVRRDASMEGSASGLAGRNESRGTWALVIAGVSVLLTLILTILNAVVVHIGH
jgi:hypothetical protein